MYSLPLIVIFTLAESQTVHNKGCGPLPENFGCPCPKKYNNNVTIVLKGRKICRSTAQTTRNDIQSSPDMAPLFFHRNLWRYIEGDGKSKYSIARNFCSQTFMGAE